MRGLRVWHAVVAASAVVVAVAVLFTGVGWLASLGSRTVSYSVMAPLTRVELQLTSGDAAIVGSSSPALQVRHSDSSSFGHSARERRWVAGGVLHIVSRCPRIVLGSCSASYEVAVPQGVAVKVRTGSGSIRMDGFNGDATLATRSGDVDIAAYCGFHLSAASESGSLHVTAACPTQNLRLQTGSGDVVALVPPGHYRIAAISGVRRETVTGVKNDPSAVFTIAVSSASGAVTVAGGL
jgi:hypothetical protein